MRWDGDGQRRVAKLGGATDGTESVTEDQFGPCDASTKDTRHQKKGHLQLLC